MFRKSLTVVLCLGLPASSFAETWKILGPRAMGMGGASVAIAEGPLAQYWNPASLAVDSTNSKWGLAVPIGAKAEFTGGVLNDANTLSDLASQFSAIQAAQKSGTAGALDATKVGAFYQALATIKDLNQPGKGAIADIAGGANFKIGKVAFSLNNFTSIGASPFVDTTNIGLGPSGSSAGVRFTGDGPGGTGCGGSDCTTPLSGANATAATQIQTSLASSYSSLNQLANNQLNGNGITANNIGTVLVNLALSNGQSTAQVQAAAAQISANAGAAAPLIAAAASGNAYTNNNTNLTVKGASLTELAMGYGHSFFVPGLFVGGSIKVIQGRVGYTRFDVLQNSSGSTDALKNFKDNTATSVRPSLDLGALWQVDQLFAAVPWHLRAGIVGKDINNPKFSQPAAATNNGESSLYAVNPQYRMGVAVTPLHYWNIAADMDLSNNLTPIDGFHSQMFGLGTEVNVLNRTWINIPIRLGLMKNLAADSSKLAYTGGFGLNFLHCMLDIGGAVSSDETQIKSGQKIPSNISVAAQFGLMF